MINTQYAMAYSEVLEILKFLPKEEYVKIPKDVIKYYEDKCDKEYTFVIDPKKSLVNQNISKQANSIIVKLFKEYFSTETQIN